MATKETLLTQSEVLLKNVLEHQKKQAEINKQTSERLKKLEYGIDRLLSLLENDDKLGKKGMYTKLNDIEFDVDGLLEREKITIAKTAILVSIGGFLIGLVTWLINNVFLKK